MAKLHGVEKSKAIARALKKAVAEHGAPNSFSPGELSAYYLNATPLEIGLSAWEVCLLLNDEGFGATYSNRAFHIQREP